MYREFDPSGNWLHAKNCHYMNTKVGCPFQFTFAGCGCACPYMHARSYVLAKWLTEQARNPGAQEPPHWHYALHHKDAKGRLLTRGLPFVEGICVNPTRWRQLDPNHKPPEKKHAKMTLKERLTQIHAFKPEMLRDLETIRADVKQHWEIMNQFW